MLHLHLHIAVVENVVAVVIFVALEADVEYAAAVSKFVAAVQKWVAAVVGLVVFVFVVVAVFKLVTTARVEARIVVNLQILHLIKADRMYLLSTVLNPTFRLLVFPS